MKTLFILTAFIALSAPAFAKVRPEYKELAEMNIECNVLFAQEITNGKLTRTLDKENTLLTTLTQIGGAEFEDAKCFLTPVILVGSGEKSTISGGCFSLEKKNVLKFTKDIIELKEDTLKQRVLINLKTGEGSVTSKYKGCDWGRKCINQTTKVQLNGCFVK